MPRPRRDWPDHQYGYAGPPYDRIRDASEQRAGGSTAPVARHNYRPRVMLADGALNKMGRSIEGPDNNASGDAPALEPIGDCMEIGRGLIRQSTASVFEKWRIG